MECCNKVGGINTPSHSMLYGSDIWRIIVQFRLCNLFPSVHLLSEAYFLYSLSVIVPKIPTDTPTRVLSSKITLRWPHKERKPPTRAPLTPKVQTFTKSPSDNLLQSNQPLPSRLRKKSVSKQNVLLRQKRPRW